MHELRQRYCLISSASVVDGFSDFNTRHSGKHDEEVQLCAFDILVEGSDDLRKLPLHLRETSLERLLARRPEGIFVNPFERGEIGPDLFRAACRMGLEGLVSKHPIRNLGHFSLSLGACVHLSFAKRAWHDRTTPFRLVFSPSAYLSCHCDLQRCTAGRGDSAHE